MSSNLIDLNCSTPPRILDASQARQALAQSLERSYGPEVPLDDMRRPHNRDQFSVIEPGWSNNITPMTPDMDSYGYLSIFDGVSPPPALSPNSMVRPYGLYLSDFDRPSLVSDSDSGSIGNYNNVQPFPSPNAIQSPNVTWQTQPSDNVWNSSFFDNLDPRSPSNNSQNAALNRTQPRDNLWTTSFMNDLNPRSPLNNSRVVNPQLVPVTPPAPNYANRFQPQHAFTQQISPFNGTRPIFDFDVSNIGRPQPAPANGTFNMPQPVPVTPPAPNYANRFQPQLASTPQISPFNGTRPIFDFDLTNIERPQSAPANGTFNMPQPLVGNRNNGTFDMSGPRQRPATAGTFNMSGADNSNRSLDPRNPVHQHVIYVDNTADLPIYSPTRSQDHYPTRDLVFSSDEASQLNSSANPFVVGSNGSLIMRNNGLGLSAVGGSNVPPPVQAPLQAPQFLDEVGNYLHVQMVQFRDAMVEQLPNIVKTVTTDKMKSSLPKEKILQIVRNVAPDIIRRQLQQLVDNAVDNMLNVSLGDRTIAELFPQMAKQKLGCLKPCRCPRNRGPNGLPLPTPDSCGLDTLAAAGGRRAGCRKDTNECADLDELLNNIGNVAPWDRMERISDFPKISRAVGPAPSRPRPENIHLSRG